MTAPRMGTIAFVVDDRLSRQRGAILTRVVNALRQFAKIELIPGKITEEDLVKKLEGQTYDLVLAPWYRYLAWSKVEGHFGLTRSTGPTFAGYFCESILPYELGEQVENYRAILLDFCNLDIGAIRLLVKSLITDTQRSGLLPLLAPKTPIYCQSWHHGHGLGHLIDAVSALPELEQGCWSTRMSAIRICLGALWGLIYEIGPGKSDSQLTQASKSARAYLQLGVDQNAVIFRLCYAMPNWTPRDALVTFWPNVRIGTAPSQLLIRHSDFVRVHHIPEPSDIEITLGFFANSPVAENYHGQVHTLWIEPLSASAVKEVPFEIPNAPSGGILKPLPSVDSLTNPAEPKPASAEGPAAAASAKAQRFILEAAAKIRELKAAITERDDQIRELRSGGVGTARALPPPDVESLIEAFQERLMDSGFQIQQLSDQLAILERNGGTAAELESLRQKMVALTQKQQSWIRKIAGTVEVLREARKPKASGEG